jgi:hypothetical protein
MKSLLVGTLAAAQSLSAAMADVTVTRRNESGGYQGMGAFQGTTVSSTKGSSRRDDNTLKFTGALLGKLGASNHSVITQNDADKIVNIDHKSKTYAETSITDMARSAKQGMEKAKKSSSAGDARVVTKADLKVDPLGGGKTFAGLACQGHRITLLLTSKDAETGEVSQNRMVTETWNAAENADLKALREAETAYAKAFMKKMGLDMNPEEAQRFGGQALAALGLGDAAAPQLEKVKAEMSKIKGFPMSTEIKWFTLQPEGKSAAKAPEPRDDEGGMPDLSGGAQGLLGGMAAKMAKKKMAASQEKKRQAAASGEQAVFSSRSEVQSVKVGPLSPDTFQVPAGYKKK